MADRNSSAMDLPKVMDQKIKCLSKQKKSFLGSVAAINTLAGILRGCYGPCGRLKFLVSSQGKTVCTGYAATILGALELEHPAAQLLREAAQTQAENSGDGTTFVVLLVDALLEQAEAMVQAGLPHSRVREAYAVATDEALKILPTLVVCSLDSLQDPALALRSAVYTHSLSHPEYLAKLVSQACRDSREPDGSFNPERLAVCSVPGAGLGDSSLIPGFAVYGAPCGKITVVLGGAKVALYACSFGPVSPHTPSNAHLTCPEDLINYKNGEERMSSTLVTQLASKGINVVVVWGQINEISLLHADQHGIMVVQAKSKRQVVQLSQIMGITMLPFLMPPLVAGECLKVYTKEMALGLAVVFEWDYLYAPAFTVILRGSTTEGLKGAEQAVHHAIKAYAQLSQDPRLLPGAGATELALAKELSELGNQLEGPNGPGILAFARALRSLPVILAENAGIQGADIMAQLQGHHQAGNTVMGVGDEGSINVTQEGIFDPFIVKTRGLRVAADVVLELVTVDDILIAKKSGEFIHPKESGSESNNLKHHPTSLNNN
ncbi:T-complex protein 1 subunit theta-like 2 [Sarcophilus harrisii]|uniref:Chaperonin containing TCP1 subunit 8 like 2 n=1 Tax=Sarcophilus harrisii TaxID=9305 RepID=G3WJ07_SARHA|nr:T-complex protein 1 subunit theta-like 2 [Sarcophilus harrisii]